jgi:hypothetical protein
MPEGIRRSDWERSDGKLLFICCTVSLACFFGSYPCIPVIP